MTPTPHTETPGHNTEPLETPARNPWARSIGSLIFVSRWLQAPLYIGLIVAQLVYVVVFMIELWHLISEVVLHPTEINESVIMLSVLGLIDVVMIANLLIMVIIGGYETFVSRINTEGHPDQPEWLSHVNANVLKVKLAMAIIGISSIHLLKTFIAVGDMQPGGTTSDEIGSYTPTGVFWQVVIHMVFIVSALALAWIDRMSQSAMRAAHAAAPQPA
ncbi:TIGR00645 family protein [Streptomyces sp. AC495_CC817]|uniref:TIGR00645 family protein n=1 Tax=Streptomyces sp. AC495_CC817 TaxID=2823900 RepID=UPI001C25DC59|nr:TIGR00645 family protein [Streptomyces sp. AC495_CC817]